MINDDYIQYFDKLFIGMWISFVIASRNNPSRQIQHMKSQYWYIRNS